MSSNLNITPVAENQSLKEVTINTAVEKLDAALTEQFSADVTAGNVSLTNPQYREQMSILVTGAATTGRTVTLPAIKKLSVFKGDSGNAESVDIVKGSTTYTLAPGAIAILYTDGTANGLDVVAESSAAAINPYDVATFCYDKPINGERLMRYKWARSVEWPAGMTGSQADARVAATGSTTFDVQKNGVSIGTIVFSAAGTTGAFTAFGATSWVAGDRLDLVAPGTADATLADISFTFAGTRV